MAELKVSAALLQARLHLPLYAEITGARFDPETRTIFFDLVGPEVPDSQVVRAVFHETCELVPVGG
jgi:hypothetical protein